MDDGLEGDQGKGGWTTLQKIVKSWTYLFIRRHVSKTTEWNGEILSATKAAGARGHRLRRRGFKSSKSSQV